MQIQVELLRRYRLVVVLYMAPGVWFLGFVMGELVALSPTYMI